MRPILLLVLLVLPFTVACGGDDDDRHGRSDTPEPVDAVEADGTLDAVEPLPDTAEPLPDTAEPLPDTAEPLPDTAEPAPDGAEPLADTVEPLPDTVDAAPEDQGGDAVDFGFDVRVPQAHEFTCEVPWGGTETYTWSDADWICTFDVGDVHGHVYLQSSPSECIVTMGAIPGYTGVGAWISIDGQVSELGKPAYDWGGNHHNDSLSFDWNGKHYSYYHSSFGWGWRSCQNVDCLQVYAGAGGALETDGCGPDRTLPAVCSQVKADGSWDPLVDTFEKCPGDPNG